MATSAKAAIPNLFRAENNRKKATWYYQMFLARLHTAGRSARMIEACRQIRRFAVTSDAKEAGIFTYSWEMIAYEELRDFDSMWRVLRARERAVFNRNWNLRKHRWKPEDSHELLFRYAPLLYLRGQYLLGCKLMETGLRLISRRKRWSFEMLWHVFKPSTRPNSVYDVALSHFYSALGRDLRQWPLWGKFVDGFHPKLFRLSGVSGAALKEDPALIEPFFEWITAEQRRRLFSGTSNGERDLTESPERVRKRQAETKAKILKIDEHPNRKHLDRALEDLFPELAELPPRRSFRQLLSARRNEHG